MKLINPTDHELDIAFAEKVAGWYVTRKIASLDKICFPSKKAFFEQPLCGTCPLPHFTQSADIVLPWLERQEIWISQKTKHNHYTVTVENGWCGQDKTSFARAAVIALLRAHGMEIEFTK